MRKYLTPSVLGLSVSLAALALVGCSSQGPGAAAAQSANPSAKVTITVGDEPPSSQPTERAEFLAQVKAFEKLYPNITIDAQSDIWDAQTFEAKLAGGTQPTVMTVYLPYSRQLIQSDQLPDMTPYLKQLGMLKELNPLALKDVQGSDGRIYTVPYDLYSIGLAYNRKIFTEAGLNPNKPPTTWAEVRADAKVIHDKLPKVAGFSMMTIDNQGGWLLTAMSYSMGGRMENAAGTKTTMGPATTSALQTLHEMRWTDDSMGSQFLYDQAQIRQAFSAGKIGMTMEVPGMYGDAVSTYGMPSSDFGMAALPQTGGRNNGTLVGGNIAMFSIKASPDQLLAAARWVKYAQLQQYFDKSLAIQTAKADENSATPPGLPGIAPVSNSVYQRYLRWIKPYIKLPLNQFAGYTASNVPLVPEAVNDTQQLYAALDPVVQKVLTTKNANIDQAVTHVSQDVGHQLTQPQG